MSNDVAIEFKDVWKKFRKGERATALRDAIPNAVRWLRGRGGRDGGKGEFWALRDVSFEVKRGECVGIIGPNGAGKSTVLKILSRIMRQTRGEVKLNGRVAALIEVGAGFSDDLTGRENVYLNGTIMGLKKAEIDAKFDQIVEFSGVEEFIDTPLKRYSTGMRVRLGFAVAAHLDPEVLLVDEVLAVGDAAFQAKCLGRMEDVTGQGRTVVFVSHNLAAVMSLCERVILLRDGRTAQMGKPEDVVSSYLRDLPDGGQVPLRSRLDRRGNGAARFVDAYLLNGSARRVSGVVSGEPITFALAVETGGRPIPKVTVMITVTDQMGRPLVSLNNRVAGTAFDLMPGLTEVRCSLDEVPLVGGTYVLNVALFQGFEYIDHVKRALCFNVAEADFFGTGMVPAAGGPPVLLRNKWQHLRG